MIKPAPRNRRPSFERFSGDSLRQPGCPLPYAYRLRGDALEGVRRFRPSPNRGRESGSAAFWTTCSSISRHCQNVCPSSVGVSRETCVVRDLGDCRVSKSVSAPPSRWGAKRKPPSATIASSAHEASPAGRRAVLLAKTTMPGIREHSLDSPTGTEKANPVDRLQRYDSPKAPDRPVIQIPPGEERCSRPGSPGIRGMNSARCFT